MPLNNLRSWQVWAKGLLVAFISGAGNAGALMVVDPNNFNLQAGLSKLLSYSLFLGVSHMFVYLMRSPLPDMKVDDPK